MDLKKLFSFLHRPAVVKYIEEKPDIKYRDLSYKTHAFIHKDINSSIQFLKSVDKERLFKERCVELSWKDKPLYLTIVDWHSKNEKRLSSLTDTHLLWVEEANRVITIYKNLEKLKSSDPIYSFNIRILEPYIIEMREIAKLLGLKTLM